MAIFDPISIHQAEEYSSSQEIAGKLHMTADEYDEFCFELACEWLKFREVNHSNQLDICYIVSKTFHSWFKTQLHNLNLEIIYNPVYDKISIAEYIRFIFLNLRFLPHLDTISEILKEGAQKMKEKPELKEISL